MVLLPRSVQRRGLARADVLVLIIIGTMFVGACMPALQRHRGDEMGRQCSNNLKQIGLGLHNFEGTFKRQPPLYGGVVSKEDQACMKFPNVWGSTHVFILPYIEQDNLYTLMATGTPSNYAPDLPPSGAAMTKVVSTFVCPLDPSMNDGVIGPLGGTSYTANAQVFAPLVDETITGSGKMLAPPAPNYCDRGSRIGRIKDGSSNTIGFMHSYGICGSNARGTAWGYTAGLNKPPSTTPTFQPWSRASYIGQSGMIVGRQPFQIRPGASDCDPLLPASPHNVMLVLLMDASIRNVVPAVSVDTWNKACLPNDGNAMPQDW